jgi:hypothetical protein
MCIIAQPLEYIFHQGDHFKTVGPFNVNMAILILLLDPINNFAHQRGFILKIVPWKISQLMVGIKNPTPMTGGFLGYGFIDGLGPMAFPQWSKNKNSIFIMIVQHVQ